jgi:Zn ribbon nucleic-acid-binding protein
MSEIIFNISLPLDSDGFLRRECPLCKRQYKIETSLDERKSIIQKEIEYYLVQNNIVEKQDEIDEDIAYRCPYCGETSSANSWWTEEQIEYIHIFPYNYMAETINEQFDDWKRNFSGMGNSLISLKFDYKKMPYKEPWISPEIDDMVIYVLPCCKIRVKLEDKPIDLVYCYKCGFPHIF